MVVRRSCLIVFYGCGSYSELSEPCHVVETNKSQCSANILHVQYLTKWIQYLTFQLLVASLTLVRARLEGERKSNLYPASWSRAR